MPGRNPANQKRMGCATGLASCQKCVVFGAFSRRTGFWNIRRRPAGPSMVRRPRRQAVLGLDKMSEGKIHRVGFLRPQIISIPYTIWNTMARTFARAARAFLKLICFYIILVAAGRAGSSLKLSRPASDESLWVPRRTLANTGYFHQYDGPGWCSRAPR